MPSVQEIENIRLCQWLQAYGVQTWDRIAFSHRRKTLNTHEVTITENLVFYLYMLGQTFCSDIQIYEAIDESANGNDLEIFVNNSGRLLWFPTQAKIVKPDTGKYNSISHKVGNPPLHQIGLLHSYAGKYSHLGLTGFPLYLFYNHVEPSIRPTVPHNIDIKEYGTSIVSEKYIYDTYSPFLSNPPKRRWKKLPTFADLHFSNALPLYKLCSLMYEEIDELSALGLDINLTSEISTDFQDSILEEIFPEASWTPLVSKPGIGRLPTAIALSSRSESNYDNQDEVFNAKYSIVLSKGVNATTISLMR